MKNVDSEITDKIVKTVFYIDRMVVCFIKKPKGLVELLEGHCDGINTPPISDKERTKYKKSENFKFLSNCYYKLDISQPSKEALEILAGFMKPGRNIEIGHVITHFEPVMDLVTETEKDAEDVGGYMQERLDHNLAKGKVTEYNEKGTHYWNNSETDITLVLYSDKPSKVSKKPCVHIEYRFESTDAVHSLGSQFFWVQTILELFDEKAFWKGNLKLIDPDSESDDEIENSPFFKTKIKRLALNL